MPKTESRSEPETAVWEQKLLKVALKNMIVNLDVAILAAKSLGKSTLLMELQYIKRKTRFLHT